MGSDTDVEDDLHASVMDDDTQTTESLRDMAFQNVTDPGNFTGPVFPYWEDQPTATKGFWHIQKAAAEHVTKCIDNGEDVIDFK